MFIKVIIVKILIRLKKNLSLVKILIEKKFNKKINVMYKII